MEFDFKNWLLNEMPITSFNLKGKWGPEDKPYRFDKKSIGILTNPNGVEKIHRKWSNTKNNFDLYFVRQPGASKYAQIGKVSPEWVKQNLNLDIEPNPDSITVIFTNNIGAEKMPLTAWTIAHRLGHALFRTEEFNDFFEVVQRDFNALVGKLFPNQRNPYNQYSYHGQDERYLQRYFVRPEHLAMAVGKMKSARDRTLFRFGEFVFELFAQYLMTGKIEFNPIPKSIILRRRMAWGRPNNDSKYSQINDEQLAAANQWLDKCANRYNGMIEYTLNSMEGEILVM